MRILVCHNRYQTPGGEDVVADAESSLLAEHGHDVHRWTVTNEAIAAVGPIRKAAAALDATWSASSYKEMRRRVRDLRPDVVHFHNTFPLLSPAVYFSCHAEGAPVVQTLHNYRLLCPSGTFFREGKICEECLEPRVPWPGVLHGCYRGSRLQTAAVATMLATHRAFATYRLHVDAYIALTEFARQRFIAGGLPADRIVVKPNFATPVTRATPHNGGFALYVGRLSQEKGILTMLQAWKRLKQPVSLQIVGDGPLRTEAEGVARDIRSVRFRGPLDRNAVSALMASASFLVFPSECYEGMSMVLLEAMAHGTPIVGPRLPSFDDLLEVGRNSWRFNQGDAESLAAVVDQAASSYAELHQRGLNARADFESKFSPAANLRQLVAVYDFARGRRIAAMNGRVGQRASKKEAVR